MTKETKREQVYSTQKQGAADGGSLVTATVSLMLSKTDLSLRTQDGQDLFARQAGSCLLAPAVGDRVLVYSAGTEAFVLAVLVRGDETRIPELGVPDATSLRLSAEDGLELSANELNFKATKLGILAKTIVQSAGSVTLHAKQVVEAIVDKFSSVRSVTLRAETRSARIEKTESVTAGTLVHKTDGVSLQNSEISLINAKQDVRLDGERVSIG
ncbi:DUF3540 domain-containing protein [Roseibium sp. AS2]|uniref:DUF3540 domain-containing protein n=1 Tax=Roseibium sp. AS2 TaxID=3135781 RepID=UPI00318187D4